MIARCSVVLCLFLFTCALIHTQQPVNQDQVIQATNLWLQAVSKGDRAALNSVMDSQFIATTPIGDVVAKDDLVPDDGEVSRLPLMQIDGPMVRIHGDAAILMAHLKPADQGGTTMSGTFVYARQANSWKLVAVHLARLNK